MHRAAHDASATPALLGHSSCSRHSMQCSSALYNQTMCSLCCALLWWHHSKQILTCSAVPLPPWNQGLEVRSMMHATSMSCRLAAMTKRSTRVGPVLTWCTDLCRLSCCSGGTRQAASAINMASASIYVICRPRARSRAEPHSHT